MGLDKEEKNCFSVSLISNLGRQSRVIGWLFRQWFFLSLLLLLPTPFLKVLSEQTSHCPVRCRSRHLLSAGVFCGVRFTQSVSLQERTWEGVLPQQGHDHHSMLGMKPRRLQFLNDSHRVNLKWNSERKNTFNCVKLKFCHWHSSLDKLIYKSPSVNLFLFINCSTGKW